MGMEDAKRPKKWHKNFKTKSSPQPHSYHDWLYQSCSPYYTSWRNLLLVSVTLDYSLSTDLGVPPRSTRCYAKLARFSTAQAEMQAMKHKIWSTSLYRPRLYSALTPSLTVARSVPSSSASMVPSQPAQSESASSLMRTDIPGSRRSGFPSVASARSPAGCC